MKYLRLLHVLTFYYEFFSILIFLSVGLITRPEAEKVLLDQPYGTFLVRLSERIWGYAISYRAKDKCKHYLVNATPKYHFVGNNQTEHISLGEYKSNISYRRI